MKKSTLLLLISAAIFFTSTLVLLYLNYLKPTSTSTPTTGIIPTDAPLPTAIPTVDPTADWIIHENKELGISYKYPSTWYLDGELLMDKTCKKYTECLTLSFKSTTKSLQQLTSEIATGDIAVDNSDVKPVLITLGDNQVYEFRYGTALGLDSRTLYFTHENKHFLIEHLIPTDGSEKEINQILSTFKFISPTESASSDKQTLVKMLQNSIYPSAPEKVKIESTIQNNFASGTYRVILDSDSGPGGGWIAAKINNNWKLVEAFQEPPGCSLMSQYSVPVSIYGTCIDK